MSPSGNSPNDPAGRGHRREEGPHSEESDTMGRFLKQMADEERADLAEAEQLSDAVGLDRVEGTLERAWGGEGASHGASGGASHGASIAAEAPPTESSPLVASPPRAAWPLLVASAAAVLLVLWSFGRDVPDGDGAGPGDIFLGARDGLTLRTDALASDGRLRWEHASAAGLRFRLRIRDPDLPGPGGILVDTTVPGEGERMQWRDAELVSSWTGTVVIDLDVLDDSSLPVDSIRAEVDLGR